MLEGNHAPFSPALLRLASCVLPAVGCCRSNLEQTNTCACDHKLARSCAGGTHLFTKG